MEDRAIPGHWEGDLLRGSGNSHIATLVEHHSRFVMLIKIPSRDTAEVVAALSKHVRKLPVFYHLQPRSQVSERHSAKTLLATLQKASPVNKSKGN